MNIDIIEDMLIYLYLVSCPKANSWVAGALPPACVLVTGNRFVERSSSDRRSARGVRYGKYRKRHLGPDGP